MNQIPQHFVYYLQYKKKEIYKIENKIKKKKSKPLSTKISLEERLGEVFGTTNNVDFRYTAPYKICKNKNWIYFYFRF